MFTVLLAEFSVLIFIQFFGIDFFTMLNSAIQLDLNFNFSRMNIGVDKWVKVLDIQEKPFMKPLYKFIFSYL
jgi:hypothetical protein